VVALDVVPLGAAALALLVTLGAEWLHGRRLRRVGTLVFGPSGRPAPWARSAPALRALAHAALAWGLTTLLLIEPRTHAPSGTLRVEPGKVRHVLVVLDVSPSMQLADAGPEKDRTRMKRAQELLESLFRRVPLELYRISVVAVYNGAKPVVIDTRDFEVVRNILGDLPLQHAFKSGKTRLFDGLREAVETARPWNPRSTTVLLVTDGDTVPAEGMPRMPPSVEEVLVVGVGDPLAGKFIDGRQSRQDVSTLRQIAVRLGGHYWNGNERHLPSTLIGSLTGPATEGVLGQLTRREYALLACALGAALLALLPVLLSHLGTLWRPGRPARRALGSAPEPRRRRPATASGAEIAPGAGVAVESGVPRR